MRITLSPVSDIISKIDFHKVSGGNGIPDVVLKNYAPVLLQILKQLPRRFLSSILLEVLLFPVFKSSDHSNYRLICLNVKILNFLLKYWVWYYLNIPLMMTNNQTIRNRVCVVLSYLISLADNWMKVNKKLGY